MATARPFAYNPGSQISGTLQFGSVAVGTPTSGVTGNPRWFNGPDEDLGYVIAIPVSDGNQPVPDGSFASIGFYRSTNLTEGSYIEISKIISNNQNFTTGNEAYLWLSGNGYWSSWNYTTPTPTPTPTPTVTPTPTPTLTITGVTFSQAFTGGTAPTSAIETAWNTFRSRLTGTTYTQFVWSSTNGNSLTVSDPTKVQTLANNLRTATVGNVTIGANVWFVGTGCGTPKIGGVAVEFSNVGSCSASSTYALRPMINNANWGGTNQSTVGASSQTITLTFS